jgi:hypothetical protein
MQTMNLIQEIKLLPLNQKFYLMEEILNSIKKEEAKRQMERASEMLFEDYLNDGELIAFTALDFEHFYETK